MTHSPSDQLSELYRRSAEAKTLELSRKVLPEDAEDLVSRAFERLSERFSSGRTIENGEALLNVTLSALLKNHYRDKARLRQKEIPVGLTYELDAIAEGEGIAHLDEVDYDDYEFRQEFDSAIRDLHDEERDAFILTELRGLSQIEAGEVLGVSHQTIMRRADRARASIGKELART